jgi:hypothetical protein
MLRRHVSVAGRSSITAAPAKRPWSDNWNALKSTLLEPVEKLRNAIDLIVVQASRE